MCVNLCKAPTQEFFTHALGMPLTMEPNFEDYSCQVGGWAGGWAGVCSAEWAGSIAVGADLLLLHSGLASASLAACTTQQLLSLLTASCAASALQMVFGKRPPPLDQDPVAAQPCLAACATAIASGSRCHKLD